MTRFVEQTPDGQGWRIGGYRFTVGDNGTLYRQYPGGALVSVGGALANGDIINGVAHFVTDTKPTTRIGGAALVTGDRWYKSDDGTEWFWNGTYWLSPKIYLSSGRYGQYSISVSSGSVLLGGEPVLPAEQFFLHDVKVSYATASVDASNYWTITPGYHPGLGASFVSFSGQNTPTGANGELFYSLNTYIASDAVSRLQGIDLLKVGSPTSIFVTLIYSFSLIAP